MWTIVGKLQGMALENPLFCLKHQQNLYFPMQILNDVSTSRNCDIAASFVIEGNLVKIREFSISLINTLILHVKSLTMVNAIAYNTP